MEVEQGQAEENERARHDQREETPDATAPAAAEPHPERHAEIREAWTRQELRNGQVLDELGALEPWPLVDHGVVEVGAAAAAQARETRPPEYLHQARETDALCHRAQRLSSSSISTNTNSKALAFLTSCSTPAGLAYACPVTSSPVDGPAGPVMASLPVVIGTTT